MIMPGEQDQFVDNAPNFYGAVTSRSRVIRSISNGEAYMQQIGDHEVPDLKEEDIETVRTKPVYSFSERNINVQKSSKSNKPLKKSRFLQEIEEIRALNIKENSELKRLGSSETELDQCLEEPAKQDPPKPSFSEEDSLCYICFSNPANCIYLDCGHGGVCLDCAIDSIKKNNICTLCREKVVQIIEIDYRHEIREGLYKVTNSYFVSKEEVDNSHKELAIPQNPTSTQDLAISQNPTNTQELPLAPL